MTGVQYKTTRKLAACRLVGVENPALHVDDQHAMGQFIHQQGHQVRFMVRSRIQATGGQRQTGI